MSGTPSADSPVLVVGLGPVGATLALLLAGQGVRVIAVERDIVPYPHARAIALDDEALRVLQAAGVGARSGLELLPDRTVRLRGRKGALLVEVPPAPVLTGHPALSFFHQPQLERLLRQRLVAEPLVDVRLGNELVALSQRPDGVDVVLRPVAADTDRAVETTLRVGYVVGCDGARSTVRRLLGVRLLGRSAGADWLVVDTETPAAAPELADRFGACFEFVGDPRRPWVHGPLPQGAHRWEFMMAAGEQSAAIQQPAAIAMLLGERLGGAPPPAVLRAAVYTFHARVAQRWRVGRVLLAGDAAHLAPPFAGQGLGAGLRDAHNLAWKLAVAAEGRGGDAMLSSYARERMPHVVRMTALATAMGAVVQSRRTAPAAARDWAISGAMRSDVARAWVAGGGGKPASRIARGLVASGPHRHRAGEALPQPILAAPSGPVPADTYLGPGFTLVGVGENPRTRLSAAGRAAAERLAVTCIVAGHGSPARVTERWLAPARLALVRPDRVVFGTAGPDGGDALLRSLGAALQASKIGSNLR